MLREDKALALPNMDVEKEPVWAAKWERIVLEEVAMSEFCRDVGLLAPTLKLVYVDLTESIAAKFTPLENVANLCQTHWDAKKRQAVHDISEDRISGAEKAPDFSDKVVPAFICETFESLNKLNNWIIEDYSNWPTLMFSQDLFNLDKWDEVLDSLLDDIARICFFQIPVDVDSFHHVLVKPSPSEKEGSFKIRYFGYDFTHKHAGITLPDITGTTALPQQEVKMIVNLGARYIISKEFGEEYTRPYDRALDDDYAKQFGHSFPEERKYDNIKYHQFTEFEGNLKQRCYEQVSEKIRKLKAYP